jgi:hypothetical protein
VIGVSVICNNEFMFLMQLNAYLHFSVLAYFLPVSLV